MAFDLQQKVFRIPSNIAVSVGLRWDFIGADPVDLDLSAVSFTKEGKLLDCVFFNHPFSQGTDEAALSSGPLVDPQQLPYMFVSADSRIGGEEENQLPGLALAAKRRQYQLQNGQLKRMGVTETIFSRLYEEEELEHVEEALDERHGGEVFDEEGRPLRRGARRDFCDELATFVMHKIPSEADVIFLCVTSYTGADFTALPSVKCVVINENTNERVGMIDIKRSTGNGTANLVCMMCRLPPTEGALQLWDLRELNIRTFGYTFVDVLPVMLDVLGVDAHSRNDALLLLPDYPLTKETHRSYAEQPLCDVRFGIGWSGEHDLDAFMVMFDDNNRYVDFIHPKSFKLHSTQPHTARHSGDAINGFGTAGDEEFIDLIAHRVPPEVRTIIFGLQYVESFGHATERPRSIYDVPQLYARLQNRTMERPKSFEVDRWNIHGDTVEADARAKKDKKYKNRNHDDEGSNNNNNNNNTSEVHINSDLRSHHNSRRHSGTIHNNGSSTIISNHPNALNNDDKGNVREDSQPVRRSFLDAGGKKHPVRTLVFGAMVRAGEVSFSSLFPAGRLDQQQFRQEDYSNDGDSNQDDDMMVPLFDYCPLHEDIPCDAKGDMTPLLPFLRCIAQYRSVAPNAPSAASRTRVLDPLHNEVDWRSNALPACDPSLWVELKESGTMLQPYAVHVQFLEVRGLRPTLPDRFRCHGEAWVCDGMETTKQTVEPCGMQLFRTPYLIHASNTEWDEHSTATTALFLVRQFDRIRILIYEYAAVGYVDLDLMQMHTLWADRKTDEEERHSNGLAKGAFNVMEKTLPLNGGPLCEGEVRVRLYRVPTNEATQKRLKVVKGLNEKRKRRQQQVAARKDDSNRRRYDPSCNVM